MNSENSPINTGTFRDEIAMRVLPSLISRVQARGNVSPPELCALAYVFADTLIKARGGPLPTRYGKKN